MSSQITRIRTHSTAPRGGSSTWWNAILTCVSSSRNSSSSLSIRNAIRRRRPKYRTSHRRLRESQKTNHQEEKKPTDKNKEKENPQKKKKKRNLCRASGPLSCPVKSVGSRHFHASDNDSGRRPSCSNFGIIVSSRYGRAALWYYYSSRVSCYYISYCFDWNQWRVEEKRCPLVFSLVHFPPIYLHRVEKTTAVATR